MSRVVRTIVGVSAGAFLVVLLPGIAAGKTASNARFAETYCDAIESGLEDLRELQSDAFAAPDAQSLRTGALAKVDSLIASLQAAADDLQKLAPQDGGKKTGALFTTALTAQVTQIQAGREAFAAADPNARTFTAAADALVDATAGALNTYDAPLAQLGKHAALRRAITKSCNIVRTG